MCNSIKAQVGLPSSISAAPKHPFVSFASPYQACTSARRCLPRPPTTSNKLRLRRPLYFLRTYLRPITSRQISVLLAREFDSETDSAIDGAVIRQSLPAIVSRIVIRDRQSNSACGLSPPVQYNATAVWQLVSGVFGQIARSNVLPHVSAGG